VLTMLPMLVLLLNRRKSEPRSEEAAA